MTELLPCPFCGGEAQVQHQSRELYGDVVDWFGVYCKKQFCGFVSGQSTEAEAIATWNSRAERTCEVEVRESAWGGYTRHCGNCGADLDCDTRNKQNYCPNCGARVVE